MVAAHECSWKEEQRCLFSLNPRGKLARCCAERMDGGHHVVWVQSMWLQHVQQGAAAQEGRRAGCTGNARQALVAGRPWRVLYAVGACVPAEARLLGLRLLIAGRWRSEQARQGY